MKQENLYIDFLKDLKSSILHSKYLASKFVIKEQLLLYLQTGKMLSDKIAIEKWGTKVVEKISNDLQIEIKGLRGFSYRNLMKMKLFADEYISDLILTKNIVENNNTNYNQSTDKKQDIILPLQTAELENTILPLQTAELDNIIVPLQTAQLENTILPSQTAELKNQIVQLLTAQFQNIDNNIINAFFGLSFSHHLLLISKCKNLEERYFYMNYAHQNYLTIEMLEYHIKSKLYKTKGNLPNNFEKTLPKTLKNSALQIFKDEYLFDYITIGEDDDEKVFENEIVSNIKKFIMTVGKGFSFIGNQYRIELSEKEYFIDLLFYNRILQCLVAFELKRGNFKPEFAGKLNFYLNILDYTVKLPNENPSIGIILCKQKDNAIVEYSFKNINKAMGVATYETSEKVPEQWKEVLPSPEDLRKLL